ncbi:MAG: hypothetical protein ABSG41_10925 [Bryobacteraceae bacterium]|jgi:hypothetical protein
MRETSVGQSAGKQAEQVLRTRGSRAFCRVDLPIMGLAFRNDHHAAVTIQAGEILEVVGPAQDDRFMIVEFKGEQCIVFERDLKYRGKPVPAGKARAAVA